MIKTFINSTLAIILPVIVSSDSKSFSAVAENSIANNSTKILNIGDTIPEGSVATIEGKQFRLSDIISQKPTVLIFYRGGWCPYCNTHLGKLQTIEQDILKSGYQIIAISPDRPEELRKSISKHDLTYSLYSDSTMNIAKAFGLAFTVEKKTRVMYKIVGINLNKSSGTTHNMLPVPAAFIINTKGVIRFAHSDPNYKVRIDTDEILKKIKEIDNEN